MKTLLKQQLQGLVRALLLPVLFVASVIFVTVPYTLGYHLGDTVASSAVHASHRSV